jgi:hypothetical protein
MALFSRRFLQSALDESSAYLSLKQREDICKLLNVVRDDYMATEWELAIVHALSSVGTVRYEPDLGGTSHPDVLFNDNAGLSFVADITSVSDRTLRKQNPFDALQEELTRQERKMGLIGGFDVYVDAYPNKVYRGAHEKPRLKLPKISEFRTKIFDAKFREFMEAVRQKPEVARQHHVNRDDTSVRFTYTPSRRGFGGGSHPSFDHASIIDQNPVYNALASKAKQLKNSGFEGIRGVFLCDAGCRMLHDKTGHWASFRIDEVVHDFLRQYGSISFVATFVVVPNSPRTSSVRDVHIEVTPLAIHNSNEIRDQLEPVVKQMAFALPQPQVSPENALNHLKGRDGMTGWDLGNLTCGGDVEMSARMLLEILAGKMTIEEFESEYRMSKTENPFSRMLSQGRLITEVVVKHHSESDDDRVTIRFGKPDAAISPFTVR